MKKALIVALGVIFFSGVCFISVSIILSNLPTLQFFLNSNHKLTPNEEVMLKRARHNPSPIEYSELYESVVKIAYPTPYVEIGRCSPYPLTARVPINTELNFVNSDNKSHILFFTESKSVTFKPKEKKSVLIDFYHYVPSPYGYSCDNSPYPVGILMIVQN